MPWPPRGQTSLFMVVALEDREKRLGRGRRAESRVLEPSSHQEKNASNVYEIYATLCNFCNRRAVTIQTYTLPGSS